MSQPIISEKDINTIFYRIEDLHALHKSLCEQLETVLLNWSVLSCVGDFFVELVGGVMGGASRWSEQVRVSFFFFSVG